MMGSNEAEQAEDHPSENRDTETDDWNEGSLSISTSDEAYLDDELDRHLEEIMEETRREIDNEIQKQFDDEWNEHYEKYIEDYFAQADQEREVNDLFLHLSASEKDATNNALSIPSQKQVDSRSSACTTFVDINTQIQKVIDQYNTTALTD